MANVGQTLMIRLRNVSRHIGRATASWPTWGGASVPHDRRISFSRALRASAAGIALLMAALALSPANAWAAPMQAYNSRVVLDLPGGYAPSTLFSGFQNDELGVSYVILELPASAYSELAAGFAAAELAKRGLSDAEPGKLARQGDYIYMRARQNGPSGAFAKFFALLKTDDQAVLVSVNAPLAAVENGSVDPADIERVLGSARTAEKATSRDLYRLGYLGPFREAGSFVGTARIYTLDGALGTAAMDAKGEQRGETRSVLIVAPSLDARQQGDDAEATAHKLLKSLAGYRIDKFGAAEPTEVNGVEGIVLTADAVDSNTGQPVLLHQTLLLPKGGGYLRLVGIATLADRDRLAPEFTRIAKSVTLAKNSELR